jgi:2-oxoglutarate ferredoxin oxidoreductase subunit gamma
MQTEVIMAGFGGQGLMMIGKLLALAGLEEGKEVTWLPSYGPEMRGGTANCTVVVGNKPIGSPLTPTPKGGIVMNRPSHEKFAPAIKPGGVLVVNSSLIPDRSDRKDIKIFRIRANDIAMEAGSGRSANLVVLGAYIGLDELVNCDTLLNAIKKAFAAKKQFLEINCNTFMKGYELAKAGKSDD